MLAHEETVFFLCTPARKCNTDFPEAAGLQLPLFHADISAFKAKLQAMPASMWTKEEQARSNVVMSGRTANMDKFKPGVQGIVMLFSDRNGHVVYQFPYYDYFRAELEPLLNEVGRAVILGTSRLGAWLQPAGHHRVTHLLGVPRAAASQQPSLLCDRQLCSAEERNWRVAIVVLHLHGVPRLGHVLGLCVGQLWWLAQPGRSPPVGPGHSLFSLNHQATCMQICTIHRLCIIRLCNLYSSKIHVC